MNILEQKLREAWIEFQKYSQKEMGYTNRQNLNECLNGAGAFVDFICGRTPKAGTSYATHLPGKCLQTKILHLLSWMRPETVATTVSAVVTDCQEEGIVSRTTTLQIQGKGYKISDNDIRRVARAHTPESLVGYYIEVEGKQYPPKQLIRLATGTRDVFNSTNARSALTRLGFIVQPSH
ncbi:MAG: hypothetical protein HOP22_08690 [Nitrospiraceae bacterium]|nr:hypothetical protein [Nitrospiraceae bacterium]